MGNYKKNILILLLLISIFSPFNLGEKSFAIESKYNNNLLKLDVTTNKNGDLDLTLYSTKDYNVKITPVKRSEDEYVILLPQTYHSITTKPTINSSNSVKDVDVKLIPYIGSQSNNGYTKITVKTTNKDVKFNINNKIVKQADSIANELSNVINRQEKPIIRTKTINIDKEKKFEQISKIAVTKPKIEKKEIQQVKTPSEPTIKEKKESSVINIVKKNVEIKPDNLQKKSVNKPLEKKTADINNISSKKIVDNTKKEDLTTNKYKVNKDYSYLYKPTAKTDNPFIDLFKNILFFGVLTLLFIKVFKFVNKRKFNAEMQQGLSAYINSNTKMDNVISPQEVTTSETVIEEVYTNNESIKMNENINQTNIFKRHFQEPIIKPTPIKQMSDEPEVIEAIEIEDGKAFYLVESDDEKALIGIINSEVFLINKFSNISNPNLSVKRSNTNEKGDIYYLKVDKWHGLVSVDNEKMQLELAF